ncbi:universal stress protein [Candidatus Woesearchaeota archaeon]|nr:universal stress protein [Candidatus Woesearchaeota archaeon]
MYSSVLVCVSNPRHVKEMTKLALSVSEKGAGLVFLRVVPVVNDWVVRQFDKDLGFMKQLKVSGRRVKYEKRIAEGGDVGKAILAAARKGKADLVVMGAVPHKGIFGSIRNISTYVMNNSSAAVVLVKSRQ